MTHRLDGPRTKIEGAKEHIAELDAELRRYREREPYRLFVEDEPESGDRVYRIKIIEQPPRRVARIVGDVLANARAALELLAWQLVESHSGLPAREGDRKRIGFPISESVEEFETKGLRKVDGASQQAKDLLRAIKPYKGGNDSLWRLHHLNRVDHHRLIGLLGGAHQGVSLIWPPAGFRPEVARAFDITVDEVPRVTLRIKPADRQFPLKDGDEVFRISKPSIEIQGDEHPQIAIDIALSQPEILEGEPMLPTLHQLTSAVEESVELFAPLL